MTLLSVNIDHIATIREARRTNEPDPVAAAAICEMAGAHGITVHLRGDRRHIQHRDVKILRETIKTKLNIEMAATEEMMGIALDVTPDQVTLVPELPGEITTTGGLDCTRNQQAITTAIKRLQSNNINVSLFIDPAEQQIRCTRPGCADDRNQYSPVFGCDAVEPSHERSHGRTARRDPGRGIGPPEEHAGSGRAWPDVPECPGHRTNSPDRRIEHRAQHHRSRCALWT